MTASKAVDVATAYAERKKRNQESSEDNFIVHSATVRQLGGVYQQAKVHQFTVLSDEHPEPWGGGDRAPSPFQYLLASLGFSVNNQVYIQSQVAGVSLESLETFVTGSFDAKGFYDVKGHSPRVNRVSLEFRISSPSPEPDVRRILAKAVRCCPVYQTLGKSAKMEYGLRLNKPPPDDDGVERGGHHHR